MSIASLNSIELFYDEFGNRSAPVILLIMGFGRQMIAWPESFCEGLAKHGFHVVRFDNRGVGLSTKFDGAANRVWGTICRKRWFRPLSRLSSPTVMRRTPRRANNAGAFRSSLSAALER